jgi:hypothetical protein
MNRSESIAQLAAAFTKAQATIEAAKKDSDNPFFKSKYADLSEVWRVVRDAFAPHGLSVIQLPETAEDGSVTLTTTLLHESGEWLAGTMPVRVAKDDPQGVGSGITYARRYALSGLCGVVADEDDDGEAAMGRGQAQAKPRRVAPAETPAKAKPGTIGEAGRKALSDLCVSGEKRGADKAELLQIVRDHAAETAEDGKIANLSVEAGEYLMTLLNEIIEAAALRAEAAAADAAQAQEAA